MKISDKVTETMIKNNVIEEERAVLYAYGLRMLGMFSLCTMIMFILGYIAKEMVFTCSFFLSFSALRAFYKGYHAESRVKCFILSGLVFMMCIIIKKYMFAGISIWVSSLILILMFAMINSIRIVTEDDCGDRKTFAGGMKFMVFMESVYLVTYSIPYHDISCGIFMAVVLTFVLLSIKLIKSKPAAKRLCS